MNISTIKTKLKKNKLVKLSRMFIFFKPYAKYYEKCEVDKNVILYESFYGKGMTCGPYAIFKELISNPEYSQYKHVWVIDDSTKWTSEFIQYKEYSNVEFVQIKSRAYYKYLASAGYLINNSTFPFCFTRKPEQTYVNTWHGIPLKHMGYDMPNGSIESANTERNFLQASYLLSPNEHHTKMYTDAYKMKGIFEGKIIEAGQARTDTIFNSDREQVINKLKATGCNVSADKKIIMYAPTWKGESFSDVQADVQEYENVYNKLSSQLGNEVQILIKPHQATYNKLGNASEQLKKHMVSPRLDANEVLSVVDVLISDYSSIFFDFLVTGRPIMFYIPDLQEYKEVRGMYMGIDELPGQATDNIDELCKLLKEPNQTAKQTAEQYNKARERFCKYDDGKVASRIVDAVFNNNFDNVKVVDITTNKKKIFISLGRALQNGITHSFLSLLNNIDYDKYDVTAYLYEAVAPDQVVRMSEINKNVRVLVRTSYTFATRRELIRLAIAMAFNLSGKYRELCPDKYFERQARRMAGDTKFDSVVEFCGYSPVLALELPKLNSNTTSIWMHNDLLADQQRKVNGKQPLKRKMAMIFNLYPEWDRLVSCSHSVMEVNKKNLSNEQIENKFYFAKNTINYKRVLNSLEEGCDYTGFPMPDAKDINFVTMGRFSTEKNHQTLIRAFAKYSQEYPNSRLYIIGEGPLREPIENVISELSLKDRVILTGNLANPFTLMSKCQCFILPSIYEGQPMVLLEARIVGLAIVVSDFSSVKDSLVEHGQYLIQSTEESIVDGLKTFSEGKVETCDFDPREYNREAVQEFERAIGN